MMKTLLIMVRITRCGKEMPRRIKEDDKPPGPFGDWLGEEIIFEKEMRKARYSEKFRPPKEFRNPKEKKFRPIKKSKSKKQSRNDGY